MKNTNINTSEVKKFFEKYIGIGKGEIAKIPETSIEAEDVQLYAVTCFYPDDVSNATYLHTNWSDSVNEAERICRELVDDEENEYDSRTLIDDKSKNCVITVFVASDEDDLDFAENEEIVCQIIVNKVYNTL